jgi:hypothetical protein
MTSRRRPEVKAVVTLTSDQQADLAFWSDVYRVPRSELFREAIVSWLKAREIIMPDYQSEDWLIQEIAKIENAPPPLVREKLIKIGQRSKVAASGQQVALRYYKDCLCGLKERGRG